MTLDGMHRELQTEFKMIEEDVLPELIKEKNKIMGMLQQSKNTEHGDGTGHHQAR